MIIRILPLFALLLPLLAQAETFTWDCNTEADMKEYRGERSDNGGANWGVLFKKEHVPGCSQLSFQSTSYVKPGDKLGRLFSCDKAGQCSMPSKDLGYKIASPLIGNTGGQTETPLSPSPFAGAVSPPPPVVTPPPPVVTPPPMPPVTPSPGAITNWGVTPGAEAGSLVVTLTHPDDGTGSTALVDVRIARGAVISWGSASNAGCASFPCTISGLADGETYSLQAIAFRRVPDSGSAFGPFSSVISVTTNAPVVAPPPIVPPPPVITPDLEARLAAVEGKVAAIETMGSVLDEELRDLRAMMKAVCRALGGTCP